VKLIKITRKR